MSVPSVGSSPSPSSVRGATGPPPRWRSFDKWATSGALHICTPTLRRSSRAPSFASYFFTQSARALSCHSACCIACAASAAACSCRGSIATRRSGAVRGGRSRDAESSACTVSAADTLPPFLWPPSLVAERAAQRRPRPLRRRRRSEAPPPSEPLAALPHLPNMPPP